LTNIERCGAVVHIAADGEKGAEFKRKDEAFRAFHGLTNADYKHSLHVIEDTGSLTEKVNNVWAPSLWIIEWAKFLAELRETEKLAVVFVDTLLGVAGGGDTSNGVDMQAIMDVTKLLTHELDCSVQILNHFTKGGAKDPSSMDAGIGARSATATPRLITHLAKEGPFVKVDAPKKSYGDGPTGSEVFEWKSVDIPVNVFDVVGVFTGVKTSAIGILTPASGASAQARQDDRALDALWRKKQSQVVIINGKPTGPWGRDHASKIVADALGIKASGGRTARAQAETIVAGLVARGKAKVTTIKRHKQRDADILEPSGPFPEPDPI
jgi:hypothetical protein